MAGDFCMGIPDLSFFARNQGPCFEMFGLSSPNCHIWSFEPSRHLWGLGLLSAL